MSKLSPAVVVVSLVSLLAACAPGTRDGDPLDNNSADATPSSKRDAAPAADSTTPPIADADGGSTPPPPPPSDGSTADVVASDGAAGADAGAGDSGAPATTGGSFPGIPQYPYRAQLPALGAKADVTSCSSNGTTVNGTASSWKVVTVNQNTRCQISGSYFVLQNSTVNHRINASGGPYVIRNNTIKAPGTGGALNTGGSDILVENNVIHHNGVIPSSADHHGMNVPGNTKRLWILRNTIYENSGDAIQFCHACIGGTHDGPAFVYIAGNTMHDDEENAIDLKEFLGPVVVVCNEMYGYDRGQFSGNGEAVRINDEGQQGEVWFAHNNYHDNRTDIAPYGSDAKGYFLDENTTNVNNSNSKSVFANGAAAKPHYDQYKKQYGLDLSGACPP
ncbi:MAG: right-handed parallel beta-helix repeat-containing protein [Myxococcales bacterium]|nr:right-handed parallel beta-helix repeat-containing protein [Myxococcales bacterium]